MTDKNNPSPRALFEATKVVSSKGPADMNLVKSSSTYLIQ